MISCSTALPVERLLLPLLLLLWLVTSSNRVNGHATSYHHLESSEHVCIVVVSGGKVARDALLRNALEEVHRQTFANIEVVVVRDGAACRCHRDQYSNHPTDDDAFPIFDYDVAKSLEVVESAEEVAVTAGATTTTTTATTANSTGPRPPPLFTSHQSHEHSNKHSDINDLSLSYDSRRVIESVLLSDVVDDESGALHLSTLIERVEHRTATKVHIHTVRRSYSECTKWWHRVDGSGHDSLMRIRFHCDHQCDVQSLGSKRNLAVSLCSNRTTHVAMMDDDDYFAKSRIERQLISMRRNKDVQLTMFEQRYLLSIAANDDEDEMPTMELLRIKKGIEWGAATNTVMFKRSLFSLNDSLGISYVDSSYGEDVEFISKLLSRSSKINHSSSSSPLLILPNDHPPEFVYVRHRWNTWHWRVADYAEALEPMPLNGSDSPFPDAFVAFNSFLALQRHLGNISASGDELDQRSRAHLLKDPVINFESLWQEGVLVPRFHSPEYNFSHPEYNLTTPSIAPTKSPTLTPSRGPTLVPSLAPSLSPTSSPTSPPSPSPTLYICGNNITEPGEDCDGGGVCCTTECEWRVPFECRAAATACDRAEFCVPGKVACPSDSFEPFGTVCRPTNGSCDVEEVCTGVSVLCPIVDVVKKIGIVCRTAAIGKTCDVQETCDGVSPHCPSDVFTASGVICRPSRGVCDKSEACDGFSPFCPPDLHDIGAVCRLRNTSDPCDVEEVCGYSSFDCPPDLVAEVMACDDGDPCTIGERCNSLGVCGGEWRCECAYDSDCEDNRPCTRDLCIDGSCLYQPIISSMNDANTKRVECRRAAGACDVAEFCELNSLDCPVDLFLPSTTVCRQQAGVCDEVEYCVGSSAFCPSDSKLNSSSPCRAALSSYACDAAEYCSGLDDSCPPDSVRAEGEVCREAAHDCDRTERCDGVSYRCPPDSPAVRGQSCDDESYCTHLDECSAYGRCRGVFWCSCISSIECFDDDNCTLDRCVDGTCRNELAIEELIGMTCDDNEQCSYEDVCDSQGQCVGVCDTDCGEYGECCGEGTCVCDSPSWVGPYCEVEVVFRPTPGYEFCSSSSSSSSSPSSPTCYTYPFYSKVIPDDVKVGAVTIGDVSMGVAVIDGNGGIGGLLSRGFDSYGVKKANSTSDIQQEQQHDNIYMLDNEESIVVFFDEHVVIRGVRLYVKSGGAELAFYRSPPIIKQNQAPFDLLLMHYKSRVAAASSNAAATATSTASNAAAEAASFSVALPASLQLIQRVLVTEDAVNRGIFDDRIEEVTSVVIAHKFGLGTSLLEIVIERPAFNDSSTIALRAGDTDDVSDGITDNVPFSSTLGFVLLLVGLGLAFLVLLTAISIVAFRRRVVAVNRRRKAEKHAAKPQVSALVVAHRSSPSSSSSSSSSSPSSSFIANVGEGENANASKKKSSLAAQKASKSTKKEAVNLLPSVTQATSTHSMLNDVMRFARILKARAAVTQLIEDEGACFIGHNGVKINDANAVVERADAGEVIRMQRSDDILRQEDDEQMAEVVDVFELQYKGRGAVNQAGGEGGGSEYDIPSIVSHQQPHEDAAYGTTSLYQKAVEPLANVAVDEAFYGETSLYKKIPPVYDTVKEGENLYDRVDSRKHEVAGQVAAVAAAAADATSDSPYDAPPIPSTYENVISVSATTNTEYNLPPMVKENEKAAYDVVDLSQRQVSPPSSASSVAPLVAADHLLFSSSFSADPGDRKSRILRIEKAANWASSQDSESLKKMFEASKSLAQVAQLETDVIVEEVDNVDTVDSSAATSTTTTTTTTTAAIVDLTKRRKSKSKVTNTTTTSSPPAAKPKPQREAPRPVETTAVESAIGAKLIVELQNAGKEQTNVPIPYPNPVTPNSNTKVERRLEDIDDSDGRVYILVSGGKMFVPVHDMRFALSLAFANQHDTSCALYTRKKDKEEYSQLQLSSTAASPPVPLLAPTIDTKRSQSSSLKTNEKDEKDATLQLARRRTRSPPPRSPRSSSSRSLTRTPRSPRSAAMRSPRSRSFKRKSSPPVQQQHMSAVDVPLKPLDAGLDVIGAGLSSVDLVMSEVDTIGSSSSSRSKSQRRRSVREANRKSIELRPL